MRCPKCHYISFDTGERCRNCGYDFSLAEPKPASPELPIRSDADPIGPLAELPLFSDGSSALDDRPLVTPAPRPRAPLAVRRATPAPSRIQRPRLAIEHAPVLDLGPPPGGETAPDRAQADVGSVAAHRPASPASYGLTAAGRFARIAAGVIDLAILSGVDSAVVYFTLKLCDLTLADIRILPLAPMLGFFLVLNGGYLVAFTAAGGQTIGKMAARIRVVGELGEPVGVGQSAFRTAAYLVSALPVGLGFLPALAGEHRRALHDRLAETRVVRA